MNKSNEDILMILDMIEKNPNNVFDYTRDFYPTVIRLDYACPVEKYKIRVSVLIEKKKKSLVKNIRNLFSKNKIKDERVAFVFLKNYSDIDAVPFSFSEEVEIKYIEQTITNIIDSFYEIKRIKKQQHYDYLIETIKKGMK